MSRTAAGTHGVNLMPLLDVLLCTMGTLIVIMGVINREARLHPAKRVVGSAEAAAKSEELIHTREDLELRIEQLTTAREKTLADLDLARRRLGGIEEHTRRLEDQLRSHSDAAKQLQAAPQSDTADRDQLRVELLRLNTQQMELETELQQARAAAREQQPAFAVIPFDGLYKTNRRPIYIECRLDAVILQPEGLVFGPTDFMGPAGPGNPLASALRAAQDYWRQAPAAAPGVPNEPYPLLLVRPDGIIAYYLAREAMSSWDSEFGYELIGADWKLEFPTQPDPHLKFLETRAVADARQRLQWLAETNPELYARKKSQVQYRMSPIRGGIVRDGAPALGNDPFVDDPLGGFGRTTTGERRRGETADRGNSRGGGGSRDAALGDIADLSSKAGNTPGTTAGSAGKTEKTPGATAGLPSSADAGTPGGTAASSDRAGNTPDATAGSSRSGTAGTPSTATSSPSSTQQSQSASQRTASQSLADRRGRNWALPTSSTASLPIQRPIRVQCRSDRLVLLPDSRDQPPQVIPLTDRTDEAVDQLVAAVQTCTQSWGIAGQSMFWKPQLVLEVHPDAEARAADLQMLLADSGLDVKRK